jgi:predicted nucleic acid-binding protein
LALVGAGRFDIHLSVPLVLEYEDVLTREGAKLQQTKHAIMDVIDYHCAVAKKHPVFFLWRPFLRDPKDDLVLELAVKPVATSLSLIIYAIFTEYRVLD